jgi:hypothetical protein
VGLPRSAGRSDTTLSFAGNSLAKGTFIDGTVWLPCPSACRLVETGIDGNLEAKLE